MTNADMESAAPAMRGRSNELAQKADDDLVTAAQQHNEYAFEALMRRYNRRLFRVARSILRDDAAAEDAVQESYVRAFMNLHRYEPGAFGAWLTRLTINEALMLKRRSRRHMVSLDQVDEQMADDVGVIDERLTTPDTLQTACIKQLLEQAIDTLPQQFRMVFILRMVEQLSTAETAACLGINQATVKTRLHRAQSRLRTDISRRLEQEHLTLFDFDGPRCDCIVATVLGRLSREAQSSSLLL